MFVEYLESIEALNQIIQEDKEKPARFPVRFILVESAGDWEVVLDLLKDKVEHIFRLSEYCADEDSIPNVLHLMQDIRNIDSGDALIIPLSEYLRLFGDRYGLLKQLTEFYKSDGVSGGTKSRIYVPLYNVDDIFFDQMSKVSRFTVPGESAKYYELNSDRHDHSVLLTVVGDNVHNTLNFSTVANGLKQFMQLWEKSTVRDLCLVTKFANYMREARGAYSINVYTRGFELLAEKVADAGILQEEWGNDEQWCWLYSIADDGQHLHDLFTKEFNMAKLDVYDVLMDWSDYDDKHKWLAWLACKIEQPNGYMVYVMQRNKNFYAFVEDIIFAIIDIVKNNLIQDDREMLNVIGQRKQLLSRMDVFNMPNTFWERMGELGDDISKLKCLSGILQEEKSRIIEIADKLINGMSSETEWMSILFAVYPDLYYYLNTIDYGNESASEYFFKYVRAKISDNVTDDISQMVRDIAKKQLLWQYTARYNFLQNFDEPAVFYWVDGMGAEWLSLIEGLLKYEFVDMGYEYEYHITRANLPTTTEFNKDWEGTADYKEYKDYDILVHSYNCKYPKYIVEEFDHIRNVVKNALSLLDAHKTVIITADHGTSRLAAINKQKSIDVPEDLVRKHGRYCINDGSLHAEDYDGCIEDNGKLIFADYNRFKISGNVFGEIHGGATLEEVLVPVVVLRKGTVRRQVTFTLVSSMVNLDVKGRAKLDIAVDGDLKQLVLMVMGKRFAFDNKGDGRWQAVIKGFSSGAYRGTLFGDSIRLGDIEFTLKKGIMENDLGL